MADSEYPPDLLHQIVTWAKELEGDERLMIIIATSRLEDLLKRLLQKAMLHQGGGQDSLFSPDRPLGTFSSRILLAYRLGLIDRDYESFLQTLRKLRNDAAHAVQHIDLSTSPHLDRIIYMQSLTSTNPIWGKITNIPIDPKNDPGRSLFASLTFAVLCGESAVLKAKPFEIDDVCGFHLLVSKKK